MIQFIEPAELKALTAQQPGPRIIDVRTSAEYVSGHVPGARNIPLDTLSEEALATLPGNGPLVFVCKGGTRAGNACERVASYGLSALNLRGGTDGWRNAGYPVEGSGKEPVSIERQVRIAAGAMVAIGTLLGLLSAPGWFALPLFVGCGLIYSGVSNTCGMGVILMKMPWNNVSGSAKSCCS